MLLNAIFDRFAKLTPVCVATRLLLEAALNPKQLDQLFERHATQQYTRTLLFSTCVELMATVVCRVHRSLHSAYQASLEKIAVSIRSVYAKLEHLEPDLSACLVRHTAQKLTPVIERMGGALPPLLPGYRVRILDGNHLAGTQRRLKPLRDVAAGALPGQTLVVLDPQLGLVIDVVCCEDGHAQERSLLQAILANVEARDLYLGDRNFCTTTVVFGIARREAFFLVRQHASTLRWTRESQSRQVDRIDAAALSEQTLWLEQEGAAPLAVRRVTLTLNKPTRDGDAQIHLLTNLPATAASPQRVAELYRERWTIEGLFQDLTTILRCEVRTLAYPKAALFGFCVALASSNVYAAVKASLRAAHGIEKVEAEVSDYYLGDEIAGKYAGMMIAISEEHWPALAIGGPAKLAKLLVRLAGHARLDRFRKHPRGPKKPKPRRVRFASARHIATSRLLAQAKPPP
jgi:Transposase DDE domain